MTMGQYEFEELGFASHDALEFPAFVNLCVIRGSCPCSCIHCPVGSLSDKGREKTFGKTTISMKLFQKIVDEMASFPLSTLRIHGVGEPILWRSLPEALQYARNNNVLTWLFTCLVTGDSSLLMNLARNCNIIEISINSCDPEDYKKTKGIDAFHGVVDNIKVLRRTIEREDLPTRMVVSRVQSEDDEYDSSFLNYWKSTGLVNDAFIRTYHDYNHLIPSRVAAKKKADQCLVHWARFNIDCSGKAIVCFNELFKSELNPDLILGDVRCQRIRDIWRCNKLNALRRAQIRADYSQLDFADQLPCLNCTSCQPLGGEKPTSETQVRFFAGEDTRGET